MHTTLATCPMLGFGRLANKTSNLVDFAHGIQIRRTLMCWNPLLDANKFYNIFKISSNLVKKHCAHVLK